MNRPEFHFLKSTLAVVIPSLMAVSAPLANAQRKLPPVLKEVVVTAQKREENLQEVPLAVTALDAAALDRTFARDLLDITGKAPISLLTRYWATALQPFPFAGCS